MKTEWIDGANGIAEITAIDVSKGLLKMDALNLQQKVYNVLTRIAISGGSYYDWIGAVYGEDAYGQNEIPTYIGGLSKEIEFNAVVSNAATDEEPLGTLAGRGVLSEKHKGGNIVAKAINEPCYLMGIVSIIFPDVLFPSASIV